MYTIGTAGHVDHGKSTLVKALTGIDPDRLKEEKEREMTIDLGFAWLQLQDGPEVSVVDVPGHERFVRNMLAGVGGIDLALLVVAADEGVMPQTREHMAILDLLRVKKGIVVVTKKDLVDQEWLELVVADVKGIVKGTTLADAPMVAVSAVTGEGLPALLDEIARQLKETPPKRDIGRPRLPIDRVFTMTGFGTIVTGTLVDGSLAAGQEVEIIPRGLRARIRSLQSHKKKVETALPGRRVAVNLTGVEKGQLERGDVVTTPGWLRPTKVFDAHVHPLDGAPAPLSHNEVLSFHSGTAEALARLRLLDRDEALPGEESWVQIVLDRPLPLVKGDFFILRSTQGTLGGGEVVEPFAKRHRRFDTATFQRLEVLQKGSPEDVVLTALARCEPADISALEFHTSLSEEQVRTALSALAASGDILALGGGALDEHTPSTGSGQALVYSRTGWHRLVQTATESLAAYHRQFPLRRGLPKEESRSRLGLSAQAFTVVLERLAREQVVVEDGVTVRLPSHTPRPSEEQERAAKAYIQALEQNPYSPPTDIAIDPELLSYLVEEGRVVRVSPEVVFAASAYQSMVQQIVQHIKSQGKITVAEVRDKFHASRKYALALMEYLDQQRITRRIGDERVLRSG